MGAEGWDDPLAAHQEADGDWYVGDTSQMPALRIPTDHKPTRLPWWLPLVLLSVIITIVVALAFAPDAGGSTLTHRLPALCRCGTRY